MLPALLRYRVTQTRPDWQGKRLTTLPADDCSWEVACRKAKLSAALAAKVVTLKRGECIDNRIFRIERTA
jgi:hypothetical protein